MPRHRTTKGATPKGFRPPSAREANFIRQYLVDFNGARAAQRAGYSARGARVTASRLLSRPNIVAALNKLRTEQAKRLAVTTEQVLAELATCAFSDIGDFWPAPGERIDLSKMDRRVRAAVSSLKIKERVISGKDGQPSLLERTTEIKLWSKPQALQKLGDHLGLFEGEKKDSLVDRVRKMTPEQRVARLEEIMRIARERYGHQIEHEEQKDAENHPDHSAA
jgi:phage terminase small subunit